MWCGARFRLLDCWLLLARERWVSSLQYCWQLAGFGLYSKYPVPGVRAGRQAQRCYDTSPGAGEHPPALVTPNVTINKPRARKRKRTEQSGTRAVLSHATGRCGELKVVVQNRVVGVDPLLSHRAKGKKNCHNPNCKTRAKTDPFISILHKKSMATFTCRQQRRQLPSLSRLAQSLRMAGRVFRC